MTLTCKDKRLRLSLRTSKPYFGKFPDGVRRRERAAKSIVSLRSTAWPQSHTGAVLHLSNEAGGVGRDGSHSSAVGE